VAVSSLPQHGWQLTVDHPAPDLVLVHLSGTWRLQDRLPGLADIEGALASSPGARRLAFDMSEVTGWDTGLVAFVLKTLQYCEGRGVAVDRDGLPAGVNRLIGLATAVPEKKTGTAPAPAPWLARVGTATLAVVDAGLGFVRFVGESTAALGRFVRGRASFRWVDLFGIVQDCGPNALPIVTLISFLVGLILAFMGAVQLKSFGAQIYVADLVAIAATREMGCLMTGIIVAGRTGAAFAAQLGTMRVNEEIDALVTMGIQPMDFLVLPRMVALILMMPILTVYSDLLAILGGAFVGVTMLDLGFIEYLDRTVHALTLTWPCRAACAGCSRGAAPPPSAWPRRPRW
jgi:phospholipid/cholesterol/gamma-HCH transport system permease protein